VWIDPRWKTTSQVSWAERLFGAATVVEIKQTTEMEWAGKERFLGQNKIVEKNLGYCSLKKKKLNF
jgi:hypothetical protein